MESGLSRKSRKRLSKNTLHLNGLPWKLQLRLTVKDFPLVPELWLGNGLMGIEAGASTQLCSQAGAWEQEEGDAGAWEQGDSISPPLVGGD
jgi:hypothetical protein